MPRNKKEDDLLKAISRRDTSSSSAKSAKQPRKEHPLRTSKGRRSRTSSFSFNEEDYRIIRELSAWLAGQGRRVNDTAILRALLRMAQTNDQLLKTYDLAEEEVREARRGRL